METRDPYLWKLAQARAGFKMHLRTYLIVNAALWLLWLVTTGFRTNFEFDSMRFVWPLWTTLGWGIGLVAHYFGVYARGNERNLVEKEYEKLRMKNG